MRRERFKETGMTCDGCVGNVTKALTATHRVTHVRVSPVAGEVTVRFDEQPASIDQFKAAVQRTGYGVDATAATHSHDGKHGCCGYLQ